MATNPCSTNQEDATTAIKSHHTTLRSLQLSNTCEVQVRKGPNGDKYIALVRVNGDRKRYSFYPINIWEMISHKLSSIKKDVETGQENSYEMTDRYSILVVEFKEKWYASFTQTDPKTGEKMWSRCINLAVYEIDSLMRNFYTIQGTLFGDEGHSGPESGPFVTLMTLHSWEIAIGNQTRPSERSTLHEPSCRLEAEMNLKQLREQWPKESPTIHYKQKKVPAPSCVEMGYYMYLHAVVEYIEDIINRCNDKDAPFFEGWESLCIRYFTQAVDNMNKHDQNKKLFLACFRLGIDGGMCMNVFDMICRFGDYAKILDDVKRRNYPPYYRDFFNVIDAEIDQP